MTDALSPTERTTPRREQDRTAFDRDALHALLADQVVCHLAVVVDDVPLALPTVFAVDLAGPDRAGSLYVHGSVAARSLRAAADDGREVSVTVTATDGLVLARSGFNHSMNYRSAVVLGTPRVVDDPAEKERALDLVVDHLVPGRSAAIRRATRKELAATLVVALPLLEASVKTRTGDPDDEPEDVAAGGWAGVVDLGRTASEPRTAADAAGTDVPRHVRERAASLRE